MVISAKTPFRNGGLSKTSVHFGEVVESQEKGEVRVPIKEDS